MSRLVVVAGPPKSGKTDKVLEYVGQLTGIQKVLFAQSRDVSDGSRFSQANIGNNRLISVHSAADIFGAFVSERYTTVVINNLDAFRVDQTKVVIRQLLEKGVMVIASVVDVTDDGIHPENAADALLMASEVYKTHTEEAHIARRRWSVKAS